MKKRDALRLYGLLMVSLSLGACAGAVPSGVPSGTVAGTAPDGGTVVTPSDLFGATGEKGASPGAAENDGIGPSSDAGGAPESGTPTSGGLQQPLEPVGQAYTYPPIPGDFPAPIHDFPVHHIAIVGKATACRTSSEDVIVTIEGFVRTPVGWENIGDDDAHYAYKDCEDGRAVSIYDQMNKKTFEANLLTVTETKDQETVERTGFLRISVPIPADSYPDAVYQWQFSLVQAKSRFAMNEVQVAHAPKKIWPWGLLQDLPIDPAKIALCPPPLTITKDALFQKE